MKQKGIIAEIYRDSDYRCKINKFCDKKSVLVPCVDGVFNPCEDYPEVTILKKNCNGNEYIYAVPAVINVGEWFAFGGSFIYSCDSRFKDVSKYPIPLHDRMMNLE